MGLIYFVTTKDWNTHINRQLSNWTIYGPVKKEDSLVYTELNSETIDNAELDTFRPTQPLKSFLFLYQEQVSSIRKFPSMLNTAVLGVKACDINSLQLLDKIFIEGDFIEPFYKRRRQDLLLISTDCQAPCESCFCTLLGNSPYPTETFDINLSSISSGFVVEIGSDRGDAFIKDNKELFRKLTEADKRLLIKREARRKAATEKVNQQNKEWKIKSPFLELLRKNFPSKVWEEMSKTCVTCGACTQVCPTCYCFLLEDAKVNRKHAKLRTWDSCQYTGFARVAGGANPRKKVQERLRHRYLHKFDYIRENYGFDGCTGCGRCIEVCLGKIDMRKVLDELKREG